MQHFPIFIDTQNLHCLIIGGGEVAARKAELLLKTQARITLLAPEACDTVKRYADQQKLQWLPQKFRPEDLQDKQLVIAATDDHTLNASISKQARQLKIPVNVVDSPELCTFITPAIIERGAVTIALSSGGVAPVLLRHLREKLESILPQRISQLGELAQKFRDQVKARFTSGEQRRHFWEKVFTGPVAEKALSGDQQNAELMLSDLLHQELQSTKGDVALVGAGPGDPELLTFKALRLMQQADVVVYDRLVSDEILNMVRRDAEKIYVGKAASNHTLPQEQINQLLAELALQGKRVVRLKGGDPFIFGRGGEELETLIQQGVPFQVVPGISAANGAASYAGIPLTHRDHAQSVVFATGHLQDNSIDLDWPALVQKKQTLVFYMGLTGLSIICKELTAHGMNDAMPVAIVQSATTANQKVVTGNLADIEQRAIEAKIQPPALIIVGTVVDWYKNLSH